VVVVVLLLLLQLLKILVFLGCYTVSLDKLTPMLQRIVLLSSSGSSSPYFSSVWEFMFPVIAASVKIIGTGSSWSVSQYVIERFVQGLR